MTNLGQKWKWWTSKPENQTETSDTAIGRDDERKRAFAVLLARLQQRPPLLPVQTTMLGRVWRAVKRVRRGLRRHCICACIASLVANLVATMFFFLMQWLARKNCWSFFN